LDGTPPTPTYTDISVKTGDTYNYFVIATFDDATTSNPSNVFQITNK